MNIRTASLNNSRLFLYIAVIVVLNIIVASVPSLRLDLTERKSFTLSPVTKATLGSLREPLTIRAYLSDNLPPRFNGLSRQLKDLLQIFAASAGDNFNFAINTIKSEEGSEALVKEARSYGIYQTSIQAAKEFEYQEVSVYLGLVIIQGDSMERLNPIRPESTLEYELTSAIQRMNRKSAAFLSLPQPVQVLFYYSPLLSEVNRDWTNMGDTYRRIIKDELGPQFYGQLSFQQVDPSQLPAGLPTPQDLRLSQLNVTKEGQDYPVYASLVLKNGEQTRAFNLVQKSLDLGSLLSGSQRYTVTLPDPASVKDGLAQSIEQMVGVNQKISYVQDLGTPPLSRSPYAQPGAAALSQFNALISKHYDIKPIDIAEGIPAETNVMLLVDPSEKLNAWQLYQLDQYLMYGGALALFASPYRSVNVQQYGGQSVLVPNVNLIPGKDGEITLADLLRHYGVTIKNSMLFDTQAYVNRGERNGRYSEQTYYFLPEIRNSNINPDVAYLSNLQFLIYQSGAALEIDEEVATPLIWSSPKAWTRELQMQDNPLSVAPPADDQLARYPLIALRRGAITSFFADKDKPQRPTPEKKEEADGEGQPSEEKPVIQQAERPFKESSERVDLLVSGNGDLLSDNLLSQVADNVTLAVNLINVISGEEDLAILRAKGNSTRYMDPNISAKRKNMVVIANLVGSPLLVGVLGLLTILLWRARRRRIEVLVAATKEKA